MLGLRRGLTWAHLGTLTLPRARFGDWGYISAGKRDQRLDLLRGFAVAVMVIDHFGGSSWLYYFTGNNSFYVSGAEAFVFISGVVVGMVYGGIALERGLRAAQIKALQRAWTLYGVTVALTLWLGVFSVWLELPWAGGLQRVDPFGFVMDVITLHQTFYLSDVMLLYAFLMLATPVALWLLVSDRAGVLFSLSAALWFAYQLGPMQMQIPWTIAANTTFNLAAWQFLFFTALIIGFHRDALTRSLAGLPRIRYWIATGVTLMVLVYVYATPDVLPSAWFVKSALAVGRIAAGFVVFQFAYLTATLCWQPIRRGLGWLLLPLGENALYAFIVHVGIVAGARVVLMQLPEHPATIGLLNTTFQIAAILLIWKMIQRRVWFNLIPR